jgi:hypothetical protein
VDALGLEDRAGCLRQRALELFRRAAREERVSAERVPGLITYLYRSRHDARARFQQAT